MFHNLDEVLRYIQVNEVQYVDFKMTDLRGRWKHVTIPAENLNADTMKYGIGFDGSNYGYAEVKKSDMVFIPDLSSAVLDPFAAEKTLVMIGDVMVIEEPENKPFNQYPRNVAKAALEYMRSTGIADEMIIGPEYEFHVFDSVSRSVRPDKVSYELTSYESHWSADEPGSLGYHNNYTGGYHADIPSDSTYNLRNEICTNLKKFGVKVKYHHHEVGGSGQLEIEVSLGDMLKLADDTLAAKYVIRNTAVQNGVTATFMPKPVYGEAGNGMHVHMLLRKEGKPLFYEEGTYANLSKTAMYFIGGLLKHVRALCAFTNPSTNSYKRLLPGFEAPTTVGYALANRSSVIRIPSYAKSPDDKRFELRSPDATCNPYFAYSAILMAGLDGILNKIDPKDYNWGPFDFNLYELSEEEKKHLEHLPTALEEAVNALEEDREFLERGGVFPEELIRAWIEMLKKDAAYVGKIPHPAEIDLYYSL
ncbi:MAG: type I glutamate--ammonia ligase [Erysipelotrichales bacterium]|nr:type I glutamate--ammonia ligase [Erysipelotrichales bacterium]